VIVLQLYYSGAIELWGLTIPQFSRGRYISERQVELYNVGFLFPPPILSPRSIHRAIYIYNSADEGISVTLDILGPYPSTRPETLQIALGSSTPTFYIDYLSDETESPSVVGGWSSSVSLNIPTNSAFPIWLRLSYSNDSTPTNDAYFILRANTQPVSYIVYSYRQNRVTLPSPLWGAVRSGLRLSEDIYTTSTTPSPIYAPGGLLYSDFGSIQVNYPLIDGFAESDYAGRVIFVLANAIAEFWLRADAASRFSSSEFPARGDAATLFAIPEDLRADAVAYLTNLVTTGRGDALANLATDLISKLADALANISSAVFTYRADALTHAGSEWVNRGDALAYVAVDLVQRHGDAFVRFLTIDDILEISPLPSNSVWGVFFLPPLSLATAFVPFAFATLHATSLAEGSKVRVLHSDDQLFWQPLGILSIYPSKSTMAVRRGYLRFRNERDDWAVVVWALVRG
jgi:hypothetical protein